MTDSEQPWELHIAVIQAGTDQPAIEEAVCALTPLITETAKQICRRHMVIRQLRLDFAADAVTEVVARRTGRDGTPRASRIAEYDAAGGPFPAWLWTVLENLLKDLLRSSRRRHAREQRVEPREERMDIVQTLPDLRIQHFAIDRDERFGVADIDRLNSWPPLDRVLLLVTFDLWRMISERIWEAWCAEAELSNPFPPDELPRDRGEWINLIAEFLSASPNALQNRLRRRLEKLKHEPLDYIRGISHGE